MVRGLRILMLPMSLIVRSIIVKCLHISSFKTLPVVLLQLMTMFRLKHWVARPRCMSILMHGSDLRPGA